MLDNNGYPTEEVLNAIETFDLMTPRAFDRLQDFVQLIYENWWMPDWGFRYNQSTGCLELHTGGWSGNEDMIGSLEKTSFWMFFWYKSKRGGHYWFELFQFDESGKNRVIPKFEFLEKNNG